MERRLRRLAVVYRVHAKPKDGDPPFDAARLSDDQRAELEAISQKIVEPMPHDRHGLDGLTDFELERVTWISAIGRGMVMDEPRPEPSQVEQDRRAVAYFYGMALQPDGTFALDRLTDGQRQRLAFVEARLREAESCR